MSMPGGADTFPGVDPLPPPPPRPPRRPKPPNRKADQERRRKQKQREQDRAIREREAALQRQREREAAAAKKAHQQALREGKALLEKNGGKLPAPEAGETSYVIDMAAILALPPDEREEALALLSVIEEGITRNPLFRFLPHPKQAEVMRSHARLRWLLAGNRFGKTTVVVVQTLIDLLDEKDIPEHLREFKKWHEPIRVRCIGVTMDQVENVLIETFREWMPMHALAGGSWRNAYDKERKILRFANGSQVMFNTYEQPPQRHAGVKLHRVVFDEEPPQDIWNENQARLIDYGGDVLMAMTPIDGLTFTYDRIWLPYVNGELPYAFVMTADMDDNPYLDPIQKEIALSGYSAEEREARKTGRFVHFHGRVFSNFTDRQIIPETDLPGERAVVIAIDPGIRHPTGVVFACVDPDDNMILFDEIREQDLTVAAIAAEIQLRLAKWGIEETPQYLIDPSARNRNQITGKSLQSEYDAHGIMAFPAMNDVRMGISAVQDRLADGKLHVFQSCVQTISEFRQYRWAKPGRRDNLGKEKVVKEGDDLMDGVRYICASRPLTPREDFRLPAFSQDPAVLEAAIEEIRGVRRGRVTPNGPPAGDWASY